MSEKTSLSILLFGSIPNNGEIPISKVTAAFLGIASSGPMQMMQTVLMIIAPFGPMAPVSRFRSPSTLSMAKTLQIPRPASARKYAI